MSTLTDREIAEEADRIRNEDEWPFWPVLPMQHRTLPANDGSGGTMLGLVFAGNLSEVVVMNLLELKAGPIEPQIAGRPSRKYPTVEQMVADGWMGD